MPDIGSTLQVRAIGTGWALDGELDTHTARLVADALAEMPDRAVEIDIAGLSFMDSSGLRVLVDATQRARDRGHDISVRNPSDAVRRLVEISGLGGHLTLL